ncbi:hypothetical protein HMI54_000309 [Coelomomyces lativittatus]|nr:hypothetical protein HMI55_000571 [Coelomomyces lativittatus]KAJ1511114.1 hypothetical protein HMI56_005792 [Coelomomyces lativittatus]KAJ1512057.1 hypothetical protein HMI54_000309 [Coelomomyces lativittatus]
MDVVSTSNLPPPSVQEGDTAPPPYNEPEELTQWYFFLRYLYVYLTPFEIVHGPMLACKGWHRYFTIRLYKRIHIYSIVRYRSFIETIISKTNLSSETCPFHFASNIVHQITSLHLHGKDWDSSFYATCFPTSCTTFQDTWLYTLLHGLPFLKHMELDSIPFLNESAIQYFNQHFVSKKKESPLSHLKSLILKSSLLVSGVMLSCFFTQLYKLGAELERLGLIDCPGLFPDFPSLVQEHSWWGWSTSMTYLDLSENSYSLNPKLFQKLFHPTFSFCSLNFLSIAESRLLTTECVYPVLASSPIRHLVLDGLHGWQDCVPKSISDHWHTLSIKNMNINWFQHFLKNKSTQLLTLTVSVDLIEQVERSSFDFANLKKMIIEDTQGDGVSLLLIRKLMGLSNSLPFTPYLVVIQPRKLFACLDELLTHHHVHTLNQQSKKKCFLKLIEKDSISVW